MPTTTPRTIVDKHLNTKLSSMANRWPLPFEEYDDHVVFSIHGEGHKDNTHKNYCRRPHFEDVLLQNHKEPLLRYLHHVFESPVKPTEHDAPRIRKLCGSDIYAHTTDEELYVNEHGISTDKLRGMMHRIFDKELPRGAEWTQIKISFLSQGKYDYTVYKYKMHFDVTYVVPPGSTYR